MTRFTDCHRLVRTTLSPAAGFGLFICAFVLMLAIVSFLMGIMTSRMENTVAAIRIGTVLQDLLVFMFPPLLTAMLMTRLPARFLYIDLAPRLWPLLLSVFTLFASMPALETIIQWNNGMSLPDSLGELEQTLRAMEEAADAMIGEMLKGASVASLMLSVAIVGILAGLSEELFFRGGLQRLLLLTHMNHHVAIWLGAIIFSAFHFQFFGFVPRMLLGAYFGYLVWWTRSLWIPIIVHSINNSVVVITQWQTVNAGGDAAAVSETQQTAFSMITIIVSIMLTMAGLYLIRKNSRYAETVG